MDNFISNPIKLDNGIGQGDPLSMILYIIYNADLLTITEGPNETAIGYVDDAMIVVVADTLEDSTNALQDIMEHEGGGFAWSDDHNSRFEINKLAVMHCTPRKVTDDTYPELRLRGVVINRVAKYKYLGILIDQHLNWKAHLAYVVAKAKAWLLQVRPSPSIHKALHWPLSNVHATALHLRRYPQDHIWAGSVVYPSLPARG
jgi:hypothetical protein